MLCISSHEIPVVRLPLLPSNSFLCSISMASPPTPIPNSVFLHRTSHVPARIFRASWRWRVCASQGPPAPTTTTSKELHRASTLEFIGKTKAKVGLEALHPHLPNPNLIQTRTRSKCRGRLGRD